MTHEQLKAGRLKAGLTQVQAARRLGVSQPYLSQLEKSERAITTELARAAAVLYRLPATAWPIPKTAPEGVAADQLARLLAGLGYPAFAHLAPLKMNPAAVVLEAVVQNNLEARLAEALPWVFLAYPNMDWSWLLGQARLHDAQNRLGFLVALARSLAATRPELHAAVTQLSAVEAQLERARLAREDTLGSESVPVAEWRWLDANRSPLAQHWNLFTGLTAERLPYAVRTDRFFRPELHRRTSAGFQSSFAMNRQLPCKTAGTSLSGYEAIGTNPSR